MSVTTDADRKLEEAKEAINVAVMALNDILVGEVWGHDEYRADYRATMRAAYADLLRLKDEL